MSNWEFPHERRLDPNFTQHGNMLPSSRDYPVGGGHPRSQYGRPAQVASQQPSSSLVRGSNGSAHRWASRRSRNGAATKESDSEFNYELPHFQPQYAPGSSPLDRVREQAAPEQWLRADVTNSAQHQNLHHHNPRSPPHPPHPPRPHPPAAAAALSPPPSPQPPPPSGSHDQRSFPSDSAGDLLSLLSGVVPGPWSQFNQRLHSQPFQPVPAARYGPESTSETEGGYTSPNDIPSDMCWTTSESSFDPELGKSILTVWAENDNAGSSNEQISLDTMHADRSPIRSICPGDLDDFQLIGDPPASSIDTATGHIATVATQNLRAEFTKNYGKGNYGRHMRTQHGGQDGGPLIFYCEAGCSDKAFKRKDARLKHYRKHHSGS
ncbi:hypothetical protein K469DRAFT_683143 [Zopfia rhizophila CBS 207.26]|uniref:C2H2-type domain-containing protein n=1 Tax=Zopfia rhizophila CBS 207.26 TaxID=1314779 RepID=A0A6A6EFA9_9PEZI|nr:hypothetical protein K469DRAFT_683143 [Zopfia rhizophila CBS 207.26]